MGYKLAVGGSSVPAGALVGDTQASPAAGDQWIYVVPANIIIQPLAVQFVFATDATVADRWVGITFTVGTAVVRYAQTRDAHAATIGRQYNITAGDNPYHLVAGPGRVYDQFPDWILLAPGEEIRTSIDSIKAADQISQVSFVRRQFITPG